MMLDIQSVSCIVGITGLSVLLYELLMVKRVATKGNRLFFYCLLVLHILAFQRFSFPELSFIGDATNLHSGVFVDSVTGGISDGHHFENTVLLIYLIGIAFGSIKMTLSIAKMIQLIRTSSPGKHKFERLVSLSSFQPCTFFNYILIPSDLPKSLYNSVYAHEKYHVRQMHTIDMVLWHVLSILFWFNPFVHLLKSRQARNLEYDTDRHMIKTIPKDRYSRHLLSTTFTSYKVDFYPMFNTSNIYRRIKRLHKGPEIKKGWSSLTLLVALMLLFGGTILSKASFIPLTGGNVLTQQSKPEFQPNGLGHYIASVLPDKIGNKFDNIDEEYRLHLFLDITIDGEGNVSDVEEKSGKSEYKGDSRTTDFLSDLLKETIRSMPRWIPAKENGIGVTATIQEEFHFTGEGEK